MQFLSLSALVVVALQAASSLACSTSSPSIKDANTVTVNLYGPSDNLIQTTSLGNLNECHTSNSPFATFNMAVGQNLFNRNIHFFSFTNSDCTGNQGSDQLSNSPTCWVVPFGTANSFWIATA